MAASCWGQMTGKGKFAIILTIVLLCVVIIVTVAVVVSKKNKGNENERRVKEEKEIIAKRLKEEAQSLKASMDETIEPCEDFYQFACGNYKPPDADSENFYVSNMGLIQAQVNEEIKAAIAEKAKENNLTSSQKKLVKAYSSCYDATVDNTKSKEVWNILKEIGGWPMGDKTWNESAYDIGVAIATTIRMTGISPLIEFDVSPDMKNTTRNVIMLTSAEIIEANQTEWDELLRPIASLSQSFSNQTFKDDLNDLLSLTNTLNEIPSNSQGTEGYHTLKIKDLSKEIKGVDFIQFFQIITNASLNDINEYITEDDYVGLVDVTYLQKLASLVQSSKYPKRTYANYIGARIVAEGTNLVKSVIDLPGQSHPRRRLIYSRAPANWDICLSVLSARLNYVTDRIYVDYVEDKSKSIEKAKEMITYIKEAFETLARKTDWLDNGTLSKAIEKLHAMRAYIGYPEWIMKDKDLDEYYSTLPDMEDSFGKNLKKISGFIVDKILRQLRKINNFKDFPQITGLTTTMVNAFNIPQFNAIYFPLAIQKFPCFDPYLPWYFNFGAIGSIIGHEITHGFDSDGRHHDKDGNLHDWWSAEASKEFNEKAKCFVDQYNKFQIPKLEAHVNGTLTLGENIADNGGLRQVFLAYQTWQEKFEKEKPLPGFEKYTPEQLLFISYAHMWCEVPNALMTALMLYDEHTPLPYRIWGTVSNSMDFANTFNCSDRKNMNPEKKCIIW